MSERVFNFSAGPGMLPTEVVERAAASLVNYDNRGFGIAECSHRGKEFETVLADATILCKKLLALGDTHDVLFLQGGATQLFTLIPMMLLHHSADYLTSGEWSKKATVAAQAIGKVNVVASSESSNFDHSPTEWNLDPSADYFHVCTNETVHGHRMPEWPKHPNLVVDASSEIFSRRQPVADCAIVYAGAQKNLGPAGVALVIVRKDVYGKQKKLPTKLWSFKDQLEANCMVNTPPTFGIYMILETFRWIERQGGVAAVEQVNTRKAGLLYNAIDESNGFYKGTVSRKEQRSHMNVTFRLPDEALTETFIKEAAKNGMVALKGYRSVGGIRASIYNAMPLAGCEALSAFMKDFASKKA